MISTMFKRKFPFYRIIPAGILCLLSIFFISGCDHSSKATQQPETLQTSSVQTESASPAESALQAASAAPDLSLSVTNTGFYLDTVIKLTVYGTQDPQILKDAFSLIGDYEKMLSRTIEGSDVWNINHSNGQPTEVSEKTADLIRLALHYCELSEGAFDITIAPVVSLWDFHESSAHTLPDPKDLEQALSHVDYHLIQIDGNTVTLQDPQAGIDLGAIAKGYIADRVKDFLTEQGITSGVLSLGGNILTIGAKNGNSNWNIGVQKPFGAQQSDLIAVASVKDASVVTSGTYERYFELDGVRYHHILSPKDGYPVNSGISGISIYSKDSADGDALSTTCFLLGPEKGMELVESLDGVEALFISDDLEMTASSAFPLNQEVQLN